MIKTVLIVTVVSNLTHAGVEYILPTIGVDATANPFAALAIYVVAGFACTYVALRVAGVKS